jgi:hypothetical protein
VLRNNSVTARVINRCNIAGQFCLQKYSYPYQQTHHIKLFFQLPLQNDVKQQKITTLWYCLDEKTTFSLYHIN